MARLKSLSLLALVSGCSSVSAQSPSSSSLWPLQSFKSSPLQPPFLNVTKRGQTEPGYLFVGPVEMDRQIASYPMIYSDDGQLVWQGPLMNISAYQPQELHGEPVLAYWSGNNPHNGFGFGAISILNSSYHEIHKVTLPGDKGNFFTSYGPQDSYIDIHESHITDQGSVLVTAVNTTRADLSPVGGPQDGWLQDSLVYEIDVESNEILFSWSALDHLAEIPMTNAQVPLDGKGHSAADPWSYAHLNSVAKYGENYLISSRFMCSIFLLDRNGHVIWQLHVSHRPSHPNQPLQPKLIHSPYRAKKAATSPSASTQPSATNTTHASYTTPRRAHACTSTTTKTTTTPRRTRP